MRGAYLRLFAALEEAETADGRFIPCSYRKHPRFSKRCKLSQGLHYVFARFVPGRTYAKGYELRTGINAFLDFTVEYEAQIPPALHLTELSKINAEVFRAFDMFNKRTGKPKQLATRLKSALVRVADEFDDGLPMLTLPYLADPPYQSREPLTQECFSQLSAALKRYVDYLHAKIEFRRVVGEAKPYRFSELRLALPRIQDSSTEAARALKTLLARGHPFDVPLEQFIGVVRGVRADSADRAVAAIYASCDMDRILGMYFPTSEDQFAIATFLQMQTGWNKETVLAIDGQNFLHPLTGAVNSDLVLIASEKEKSQSTDVPFHRPKTMLAASKKDDKYSAYNLIQLAKELSSPLASLPVDATSTFALIGHNPLFMCARPWAGMFRNKKDSIAGRFLSAACKLRWREGAASFFQKNEISENGVRLKRADDLNGRLRPTWIRYVRDQKGRPLSVVALQQGHASIETTDIYYDSSGPAMQLRRERLRSALSEIAWMLREKQFKGLIGKRNDLPVDPTTLRVFSIPGHEKSLWACSDSYAPDWPGSAAHAQRKAKCSEISQCLFCSRVCIFEDSLPFLIVRQGDIQEQLAADDGVPFGSDLANELKIIDHILDVWGDQRALKEASRYARRNAGLLPKDMNELKVLFED